MIGRRLVAVALLLGAAAMPHAQAAGSGPDAQPGTVFKDCRDCPEMVVVPPGEVTMGFEGGENGRYEGPVHKATIGYAFAAGRFELTNGQYRRFVAATGHKTAGTGCNVFFGNRVEPVAGSSWADPAYGRPIRDDEPVACIRWSDDGFEGVAPVGKLAPNAFGLHDMIGNVWEWIEDCYEMPYGAKPVDGSAQLAIGCDRRGSRGGAWRTDYQRQRPAFRSRDL